MSQPSQTHQSAHLEKRDSIFSHSPMSNLIHQSATETSEYTSSYHFIESNPSTVIKSIKHNFGGETVSSVNAFSNDCALDNGKSKSTASNNGLLSKDNEECQLSRRVSSLNLLGDNGSIINLDEQKSTGKLLSLQKVFFPLNNGKFPEEDQDESVEGICPSVGNRRLLSERSPQNREEKHKNNNGNWPKNYKRFNDEKENSLSNEQNIGTERFKEMKSVLFPIEEDESPTSAHHKRYLNVSHQPIQTPDRRSARSHRSQDTPRIRLNQQSSTNINPDTTASPQNGFSPQALIQINDNTPSILSPTSAWEVEDVQDVEIRVEAKFYIKRMLAIFGAISLFCLLLFFATSDDLSYQGLIIISYCYLLYYGIENIYRACYLQRERWREMEDVYNIFDAFSGIIFLVSAQLKIAKVISVSSISFIPFVATTWIYYLYSKAPKAAKNAKLLTRAFYILQTFMISAKLDRIFNWDWRIILGLTWVCFGVKGIRSTVLTINQLVRLLKKIIRRRTGENINFTIEFTGAFWTLFYNLLYVIAFIGLFGCSRAFLDLERNFGLLRTSLCIEFCVSVFLIIYTLVGFKTLTQFLKRFQKFQIPQRRAEVPQLLKKQSTINLEVEKQKSYFVMLSPTYFLPLKNGFITKKEENIKRIKKMLSGIWKPRRPKVNSAHPSKPANIEDLRNDKDALDERFAKIAENERDGISRTPKAGRARAPTVVYFEHVSGTHRDKDISTINTIETGRKQNLSADDLHFNKLPIQRFGRTQSDEDLCYLCYDSRPNAVLMSCGHGGICYECASELVKKKNECMECRSSVEAIYKVDSNLKVCDIVKGIELSKVCVSP